MIPEEAVDSISIKRCTDIYRAPLSSLKIGIFLKATEINFLWFILEIPLTLIFLKSGVCYVLAFCIFEILTMFYDQ